MNKVNRRRTSGRVPAPLGSSDAASASGEIVLQGQTNLDGLGGHPLLTTAETAALLAVKASTLKHWRGSGEGPPYVKMSGRQLRYRRQDVEAFVSAHTRTNTAN